MDDYPSNLQVVNFPRETNATRSYWQKAAKGVYGDIVPDSRMLNWLSYLMENRETSDDLPVTDLPPVTEVSEILLAVKKLSKEYSLNANLYVSLFDFAKSKEGMLTDYWLEFRWTDTVDTYVNALTGMALMVPPNNSEACQKAHLGFLDLLDLQLEKLIQFDSTPHRQIGHFDTKLLKKPLPKVIQALCAILDNLSEQQDAIQAKQKALLILARLDAHLAPKTVFEESENSILLKDETIKILVEYVNDGIKDRDNHINNIQAHQILKMYAESQKKKSALPSDDDLAEFVDAVHHLSFEIPQIEKKISQRLDKYLLSIGSARPPDLGRSDPGLRDALYQSLYQQKETMMLELKKLGLDEKHILFLTALKICIDLNRNNERRVVHDGFDESDRVFNGKRIHNKLIELGPELRKFGLDTSTIHGITYKEKILAPNDKTLANCLLEFGYSPALFEPQPKPVAKSAEFIQIENALFNRTDKCKRVMESMATTLTEPKDKQSYWELCVLLNLEHMDLVQKSKFDKNAVMPDESKVITSAKDITNAKVGDKIDPSLLHKTPNRISSARFNRYGR